MADGKRTTKLDDLEQRAARANVARALELVAQAGDAPPRAGDEIPTGLDRKLQR